MEIVRFPPSVYLLIIIAIAVGISTLVTGPLSEQEKTYQARDLEYQRQQQQQRNQQQHIEHSKSK